MNNRIRPGTLVIALLGAMLATSAHAQGSLGDGTFQTLDFESAELSPLPSGQFFGGPVPVSEAIPGWTAYIGGAEVATYIRTMQQQGRLK